MTELQNQNEDDISRMLEAKKSDIADMLDSVSPEKFLKVAQKAAHETKELQKCSKESLYSSILEAAEMGLAPDGRHGALIPRYDKKAAEWYATFMPMVQGISSLIQRSPDVAKVEARCVREGDDFDYSQGTESYIKHKPDLSAGGDREVIASYAIVYWHDAEPTHEVVSREDIEQARKASDAPNSPAWSKWYGEMARKVAVKRVAKYVDVSPEATRVIEQDNRASGYDGEVKVEEKSGTEELNKAIQDRSTENPNETPQQQEETGNSDETDDSPEKGRPNQEGYGFDRGTLGDYIEFLAEVSQFSEKSMRKSLISFFDDRSDKDIEKLSDLTEDQVSWILDNPRRCEVGIRKRQVDMLTGKPETHARERLNELEGE